MKCSKFILKLPEYLDSVKEATINICGNKGDDKFNKTVACFPDGIEITIEYIEKLDTTKDIK